LSAPLRVEHYWQPDDRRWHLEDLRGLDTMVELQHISATFALSRLYRRVRFTELADT
jgi:hypothetical protein